MAAQTSFVKRSLRQQKLLSFGLRKVILVCEIRRQSCNNVIEVVYYTILWFKLYQITQ